MFAAGDTSDFCRFTAVGGETLALTIADSGEDLDLRLLDADRNQVDESLGVTTTEVVGPVAEAGDCFVQVSTFEQTASAYVLAIGREQAVASADFVPGELLLGPESAGAGSAGDLPAMRTVWRSSVGTLARLQRPAAHAPRKTAGIAARQPPATGTDRNPGRDQAAARVGLNFGAFGEALEFRLGNAGSGALNALPPEVDVPWLSVSALEGDPATGLGSFRARVDRDLLPGDGVFRTTIAVDSDANALGIGVQVERSSLDLSADAGSTPT